MSRRWLVFSLTLSLGACVTPRDVGIVPANDARAPAGVVGPVQGDAASLPPRFDAMVVAPDVGAMATPPAIPDAGAPHPPADAAVVPPPRAPDAAPAPDASPDLSPDAPPPASGDIIWNVHTGQWNTALAFDGSGNIYRAGTVTGEGDVTVSKYDASGGQLWEKRFTASGYQSSSGIAVAADGTVALNGFETGGIDFGGGLRVGDRGMGDAFMVRLDAEGNPLRATSIGGPDNDSAYNLIADPSGDWFMSGQAVDVMVAGTMISVGFTARLDHNGNPLWARSDGGFGLVSDGKGAVYAGGYNNPQLVRHGASDGSVTWMKSLGDGTEVRGLSIDSTGQRLFVVGDFSGSITLAGRTFTSAGQRDIFVAVANAANGQVLSGERVLGSKGDDIGEQACALGDAGYMIGTYLGTTALTAGEDESGSNMVVAKYRFDGTREWLKVIPEGFSAFSLVCDPSRGIVLAGVGSMLRMAP
jgi:hypothetical protein